MEKIVTKEKQFYHLDSLGLLINCYCFTYCQANHKVESAGSSTQFGFSGGSFFFYGTNIVQ